MAKNKPILNTRGGLVLIGLMALLAAYGLGSRAIDTGSWWQYGGTLLLLIFGISCFVKVVKKK